MTSATTALSTQREPELAGQAQDTSKVAIITGASRGIGAGLVAGYLQAGYGVVGVAQSMSPSDEPDYLTVQGDISEAATAQRAVDRALDRFGRVDTLINNAGIFIGKPFTDYTFDEYRAVVAVNLTGFFHITKRAIPYMLSQGGGHIVNVSTSLVEHADSKSPSALATLTKGGLGAVTRSLAIEYASRGLRVNEVALGVIKTPMHDDPAEYAKLASLHPLGRMGEVADVVRGILYLEQATFVTGETLHIDGGQAAGR
jgi:NAD(P)-dependent dehydrogenase (short-subunit alcohol dehydrogenase family)